MNRPDDKLIHDPHVNAEYQKDLKIIPWHKIIPMGVFMICLILVSLIKGSKKVDSIFNAPFCGVVYWIVNVLFIIMCGIFLHYFS